ncbi:MAG: sulfotransferase family protein [Candidatus Marinimicrobia bacterium]|nr:sulfotransferase family protein [Candidatus Neomarinimicrobiota bacterium]MCF7904635.1 sulfotransferase family protein [Candidatus Neomarinimicrobiota bacterium]
MITIVSGLPRSGTSMMMQMVEKAGVPVLTDGIRSADESNQKGYYEYEAVKKLKHDTSWLSEAEGKAIKVVSIFIDELPATFDYRIIFMERNIDEILHSQHTMLERQEKTSPAGQTLLRATFLSQIQRVKTYIESQKNMSLLCLQYEDILANPLPAAVQLATFIDQGDALSMASVVDPSLRTAFAE